MADPALMSLVSDWPKRHPGRDFLAEMLKKSGVAERPYTPPDDAPPIPNKRNMSEKPADQPTPPKEAAEPIPNQPAPAQPVEPTTSKTEPSIEIAKPDPGSAPEPTPKEPAAKEPAAVEPTPQAEGPKVAPPDDGAPPSPGPK